MSNRVLVVEDNAVNRMMAQRMLQRLGCSVDLADSGRAALQLAQTTHYDVIFMDCSMPDMDGYDTTIELRRLQANQVRIPIIALTGHSEEQDRAKCLQAGMDDYLTKPISLEYLRAALELWTKPALAAQA